MVDEETRNSLVDMEDVTRVRVEAGKIRDIGKGLAKAIPARGFWIDVDDPAAFQRAEKALLDRLRDKSNDGPISRYLNRPISVQFSRQLVKFDITPYQISLAGFLGLIELSLRRAIKVIPPRSFY